MTHTGTNTDASAVDAESMVAVPDLPGWVWNALLDDLHERAVALYQSGNRAAGDQLAEWIAALDRHAGNLFRPLRAHRLPGQGPLHLHHRRR